MHDRLAGLSSARVTARDVVRLAPLRRRYRPDIERADRRAAHVGLLASYLRWPASRIESRIVELAALARLPPDCLARSWQERFGTGTSWLTGAMKPIFIVSTRPAPSGR